MLGRNEADVLKKELVGLFNHIQRIRQEIASIRRPGGDGETDHFVRMSDELDAIVAATEGATNAIMENVEQMEDLLAGVRDRVQDPEVLSLLDAIPEKTGAIFEACAFQDITGQRITKVVNSMQFVETRVNALINMWGAAELTKVQTEPFDTREGDKRLLNGPQLTGKGVSQSDVDALFGVMPSSQSGGDALFAAAPMPVAPPTPAMAPAKPAPAKPAAPAPAPPKPAAAPAKPAPAKPAAKAADASGSGPALGQDDIDKLFG